MKSPFVLFALFLLSAKGFSQETVLPVDGSGKYTFYEVVELKNSDRATLLNNAELFLEYYVNKKYKKHIVKDTLAGSISAKSSFPVYKRGSLGKNVDGVIAYSIQIEVKDQKYRYVITDFVFREYERNRYGRFQPVSAKVKRLEQPGSAQWEAHKRTVKERMDVLVGELKLNMLKESKVQAEKVIVKEEW